MASLYFTLCSFFITERMGEGAFCQIGDEVILCDRVSASGGEGTTLQLPEGQS